MHREWCASSEGSSKYQDQGSYYESLFKETFLLPWLERSSMEYTILLQEESTFMIMEAVIIDEKVMLH